MEPPARGEVAVCGTDASDWGTGQLMWENGQRAEAVLRFTLAERARPINWRELLGILRVIELYGEELRGRSLLVEGDNTASLAAAENESSKAEDSQELVRRLVEATERFDLAVRFTHTPGVKLDRPDQTSRGDPIEEPRVRLKRREYELLERRYGPFSEFVGAERQFAKACTEAAPPRIWMHPAHATVGSALRLLGERMGESDGHRAQGLVLVPHDERAKWWPLVRHFRVVGRWPEGSPHLEMSMVRGWGETCSTRASLILAFPRCVGTLRPVTWFDGIPRDGYAYSDESEGWHLPLPAGAFVYYSSAEEGTSGVLMQVWAGFDPASEGVIDFAENEPLVKAAELLRVRGEPRPDGRAEYELDKRGPGRGSFSNSRCTPWSMDASMLYDVTHLVTVVRGPVDGQGTRAQGGTKLTWGEAKSQRMLFSWEEAEAQMMLSPPRRSHDAGTSELVGDGEFLDAQGELEQARRSADEAVRARRVVPRAEGAARSGKAAVEAPGISGGPKPELLKCRSSAMLCEGCGGKIGWGKTMVAGGRGMAHTVADCKLRADAKLVSEKRGAGGSEKRGVQLSHRVSDERVANVMCCLDGNCGVPAETESKTWCTRACGRGVHGRSCGSFSAGVVQLGNVVCAHCRAADLVTVSCTPPEHMVKRMAEAMIVEMATGSSNTHKGYSDVATLERKWQSDVCGGVLRASDVRLPHTSEEGTYSFVLWLARDGGRARSLGTTVRQLGSYCTKLEMTDYTKYKRVKMLIKELEVKGEAITNPDTQVTTLMIGEMYGPEGAIATVCSKVPKMADLLVARETVLNDFELVGGMRVGEVCGGGDTHGMLANRTCIQRVLEGSGSEYGETIEAEIEDSKTGFGRWTVFTGETRTSKIQAARHLREWCRLAGVDLVTSQVGPFTEERPDYWVVRVSLLDMGADVFRAFMESVEWAEDPIVMRHRKATLHYAKLRRKSKTIGEELRYVNVAGGRRQSGEVATARAWLISKGMGAYVDIVPGPLIRATLGHSLTHMPYSPDSTHVHIVPAMFEAFSRVKASGQADPEYDLTPDQEPKFGNHSNRRHADRVAMRNAEVNSIKDIDIDFFFGWNLKKMREEMRLWYAGLDRVMRLRLSKVTMMI